MKACDRKHMLHTGWNWLMIKGEAELIGHLLQALFSSLVKVHIFVWYKTIFKSLLSWSFPEHFQSGITPIKFQQWLSCYLQPVICRSAFSPIFHFGSNPQRSQTSVSCKGWARGWDQSATAMVYPQQLCCTQKLSCGYCSPSFFLFYPPAMHREGGMFRTKLHHFCLDFIFLVFSTVLLQVALLLSGCVLLWQPCTCLCLWIRQQGSCSIRGKC